MQRDQPDGHSAWALGWSLSCAMGWDSDVLVAPVLQCWCLTFHPSRTFPVSPQSLLNECSGAVSDGSVHDKHLPTRRPGAELRPWKSEWKQSRWD